MECLDCKNKFKTKYSLQQHRKTAKYCLKLRGQTIEEYKCSECENTFSRRYGLEKHELICGNSKLTSKLKKKIIKLKKINLILEKESVKLKESKSNDNKLLEDLKAQVLGLQKQMADISMKAVSRPITTNNTNTINNQKILNLLPLTENHFDEQAEFLNLEHIKNGAEGYARYAVDFPLKNRLVCSDYARRKVKYKDTDGKVVTDPEMSKLSQKLFKAIDTKNDRLITGYVKELQKQLFQKNKNCSGEMDEKETEIFGCEANQMIDFITNLINQKREIKEAANGIKTDMYYNILKNVCSMMV